MKKIISYSLWGDNPMYTIGAIRNAELTPIVYPGWISRFYCGESVPTDIIKTLKSLPYTEVVMMDVEGDWTGMFWRFYPASEDDVDVMISRDCDSRLNNRERDAVNEWLSSDKGFHIMRDHPWHNTAILGGMWGSKKGVVNNMKELIGDYIKGNFWQVDQNFLREKIFPLIVNNNMTHDEFFGGKPFPTIREHKQFVGQAFNKNDEMLYPEHVIYF